MPARNPILGFEGRVSAGARITLSLEFSDCDEAHQCLERLIEVVKGHLQPIDATAPTLAKTLGECDTLSARTPFIEGAITDAYAAGYRPKPD